MADMALSLTKNAVEGTVGRVLAAIDEDSKLKAAAQQDLRFIVGEFQMMQSFLEVANDNKERTSNKVVKTWVRQLRELAFDVEDCVEFVHHLDTTSARARWSWVWRVVPLPSCMAPAWTQHLDQAVAQLKQLKARVEEVSQRNTRYHLLGGDHSGSSTTPLPVPSEQLVTAAAYPSTVDILRDLWKANAKQSSSSKCNLQHLVADGRSNELRVISVWRSAGVHLEAAHILNAAYSDPEICKEFKARARVKLMHPFNFQRFLKSLLNQLYVTSLQLDTRGADLLRTNGDSVIQDELRQLLSKHRYLIIIEDLSSTVEWDLIRSYLPDHQNGSRIVIWTNQLGFALSCKEEPFRVLQLALFPNDRYIYAFYKPSGIGITELVKQLRQRRVISLWRDRSGDTESLVRDVYDAMKTKTAKIKGVNFEKFEWVNFPSQFSLEGLYNDWRKKVSVQRCLIVIDGLQSKEHWDMIKNAGFVPDYTRSCIVIIAKEKAVAKHCQDKSWRKMDDKEQEQANNAPAIIGPLFAQKDQYYSWSPHDRFGSHGCSRRIEEALFQFEQFITPEQYRLLAKIHQNSMPYLPGVNAVWGPTGVGKSALLRMSYYSVMACSLNMLELDKHPKSNVLSTMDEQQPVSFEWFGWVDVPDPFDLAEFSRRLLLDFNSSHPRHMEETAVGLIQGHNPIQRCYETIRKHNKQKSLVVIDGLRSTRDWDSIKQAIWCHHHPKSCIFVITTDESIARHCVNNYDNSDRRTIPIRALNDTSALGLFKKVAEKQENEWTTEQNLKYAKRIVPKCGGLPKIIDAVAKSPWSFCDDVNDDLVTKIKNGPQFDNLRGVLSWMHSYFDGCSDSVKPCIFYLSVFPTNYKIRKAHLLRRWIAEGYSRDTTGCSAKENAQRLFDELVKLGIIQELPNMPLCQISGFFREYIISQPMEDNLVFALEGNCKPNSKRTVQHLTIMKSWDRELQNVFKSIDVSRLRSLTVYGKWEAFFISDDKMKRIRVLDLEGTPGLKDCDLELIFGNLLSLKFICLRGCKSINSLPKTLGGLRQLESLDVRGTSIVRLPQSITKLRKIEYIRAGKFLPCEDWPSAASEEDDSDDAVGVGSRPTGTTRTTPKAEGSDGGIVATSTAQAPISQDKQIDGARQKIPPNKVGRCRTSRLSYSMLHTPRCPRYPFSASARRFAHNNINGGVEVPEGIEKMPALHTLGTVNINSARGMDFLTKFKLKTTLPQLLKLSVCGINNENWQHLSDALSAHGHLESLLLGLDEDLTEGSCFNNPPKALKSLRLYGHIHRLPSWPWIKDDRLVDNLKKKFDLEVIIARQDDMDQLVESLPRTGILRRLCIKPTPEVSKLQFEYEKKGITPRVLKIDCSSQLEVAFRMNSIARDVNVLIIYCSKGSDFHISSNQGLKNIRRRLDTVWLKGYDEKAKYVADLKEHVAAHPLKPVFKFEQLKSA